MRYIILLVIYNKKLSESESVNSIKKSKDIIKDSKLIIWDNSINAQSSDELDGLKKELNELIVEYIHTPENTPLSKIYNTVRLNYYDESYKFLVLLDHDSKFDKNFFLAHLDALKKYERTNLYIPLIKYKNHLISPAYLFYFKGFYFKKEIKGNVLSLFKTAINSGMIIDFNYFCNKYKGYDKRLKFYGTDNYFMKDYQKNNKKFTIIDYIIDHDLTYSVLNKNKDKETFLKRYKEDNNALLINNENPLILRLLVKIYIKLRSVYYMMKFRDMRFLYD
ncbi:glycosyltransferase [Thermodesulfovibrio thiophilus]|uniref:glycosyltransferase n=1 Tax=Thermodesulfovibrio thiophilus TaxID=340095 RepID=UPI00040499D0|nr:glycosyltransferase [Thermodesulfovibrio thiophilus]